MSYHEVEVVHVVAMDQKQCIGQGNNLPWHIPADLKHFKAITQGGIVIMGRKTLESMGRALPHRINWVITRDTSWHFPGVKVAHSIESALQGAIQDLATIEKQSLFIIGGGEIFNQTLGITDRLELTHIELDVGGDTFYPPIPSIFQKQSSERQVDDASGIAFEFASYLK